MTCVQDTNCSKSEAYLREVSPLGGALTPEQSKTYRELMVAEGNVSVFTSDLLAELEMTLNENPIPQACMLKVACRD